MEGTICEIWVRRRRSRQFPSGIFIFIWVIWIWLGFWLGHVCLILYGVWFAAGLGGGIFGTFRESPNGRRRT